MKGLIYERKFFNSLKFKSYSKFKFSRLGRRQKHAIIHLRRCFIQSFGLCLSPSLSAPLCLCAQHKKIAKQIIESSHVIIYFHHLLHHLFLVLQCYPHSPLIFLIVRSLVPDFLIRSLFLFPFLVFRFFQGSLHIIFRFISFAVKAEAQLWLQ